jgi:hypothetical protein
MCDSLPYAHTHTHTYTHTHTHTHHFQCCNLAMAMTPEEQSTLSAGQVYLAHCRERDQAIGLHSTVRMWPKKDRHFGTTRQGQSDTVC